MAIGGGPIRIVLSFTIPNWLEFFLAGPVLLYRRLRYGYAFRRIALTKDQYAIVDPDDYYKLSEHKWFVSAGIHDKFYAARWGTSRKGKRGKTIRMHRVVANTPDGLVCDHINGDRLDNRKANLRSATHLQNSWNRGKFDQSCSSKYKGVIFYKMRQKWGAQICVHGKRIFLGLYEDQTEAAKGYDSAAKKHFGEFAKLNFKE